MIDKMSLLLKVQTLTLQLKASQCRNNWLHDSIQNERELLAVLKDWLGVPQDTKIWRSDLRSLLDNRLKEEIAKRNETTRVF